MPDPAWLAAEASRLLAFARGSRIEDGFGWLDADGAVDAGRPTQLWITARLTHVFALGELLEAPDCEPLADHGLHALTVDFADPEHGGWFSALPGARKEAYSHAFVLLAAASGAIAGRARLQPRRATRPVPPVRHHAWARAGVGSATGLAAGRARRAAGLGARGGARAVRAGAGGRVDRAGRHRVHDRPRRQPDGHRAAPLGRDEAIGAAATLHAVTGEDEYAAWYRRCWDFAAEHLIDRERGSWHHELDAASLRPGAGTWTGKPDVYHAFQATLFPRLPPAPSLAGALRDGGLAD